MRHLLLMATLFMLALPSLARADDDLELIPLAVGSKAPALDIAHWIKGVEMDRRGAFTPVTTFEPEKVYVIEFWATWCGPCVGSMPHLTALQTKFKDRGVSIISVSDESLPKVAAFLFTTDKRDGKLQNDRIGYTLTTDPDESVKRDYFLAAGRTGIPSAFIVGKTGYIEWIGHPGSMDAALEAVVEGDWDREAFKTAYEKAQAAERAMRKASAELRAAYKDADWDRATEVFDGLITADPTAPGPHLQKFKMLLTRANRPEAAYACGEKLLEKAWEESSTLNDVAWTVVDHKAVTVRNLDFAIKAALRANELAKSLDPAIIDTLARIYFEQGKIELAVKLQQKAVDLAKDDRMGADIRATLEKYKQALAGK